jgi:hypothetical protein
MHAITYALAVCCGPLGRRLPRREGRICNSSATAHRDAYYPKNGRTIVWIRHCATRNDRAGSQGLIGGGRQCGLYDLGDDVGGTGYEVILWIEGPVAPCGFESPESLRIPRTRRKPTQIDFRVQRPSDGRYRCVRMANGPDREDLVINLEYRPRPCSLDFFEAS